MLRATVANFQEIIMSDYEKKLFLQSILYTFLAGIIVHGFCYANTFFTHDALFVTYRDSWWKISIGRFLHPFIYFFKGNVTLPWVLGICSLFWLSCANYLLMKTFDVRDFLGKMCFTLLLVTNLTITYVNAGYTYEIDIFMLAFFFSVLSVYCLYNFKYPILITPICIVITCALYQAYFAVSTTLLLVLAFLELSKNPNIKTFLIKYIKFFFIIILGLTLYYITYKSSLLILEIPEYKSDNSLREVLNFNLLDTVNILYNTYYVFFKIFIFPVTSYKYLISAINILLILFFIYTAFVNIAKLNLKNSILLCFTVLLIPLSANLIYFLSKGRVEDHIDIVIFSYVFLYILFYTYFNIFYLNNKLIKNILLTAFGIICLSNFFYSNVIYVHRELVYQHTYSVMTKITAAIESMPNYVYKKTPILFIGDFPSSNAAKERLDFEEITTFGFSDIGFTHDYMLRYFYYYISPYDINFVKHDKRTEIQQTEKFKQMPTYPSNGYIQWIDDVIVIKISDEDAS